MFKTYSQNQRQLLPPSLNDSFEKDHIARLLSKVVDDLDLSDIERTYSSEGQHAYHPKMLLKIILYGYLNGIQSSRKIADKLHEDLVFMWLAGKQTPDFRTIADFRKNKLIDVKKIFTRVLDLCFSLGMAKVGKICVDGTVVRANANKNKNQYRKLLLLRKDKLKKVVDDLFSEAEKLDAEEDEIYGNLTPHSTGIDLNNNKELDKKIRKEIEKINRENNRKRQSRLRKINKRKKTIERKIKQAKAVDQDIRSKLWKMRKDRNTMSSIDKDATLMLMKENYIAPGYNVQLATEHQVILGYGVFSDRNDSRLYRTMVREIETNTGRKPKITIADASYGTKMNYRFAGNNHIAAFMPYGSFNKEMTLRRKGLYEMPKEIDTELERYKARQRMRLLSKEGKKLLNRRREDVEPVFGDIKRNMNFRRFNVRGKAKCLMEIGLISIGHNLKKIKSEIRKMAEYNDGNEEGQKLGKILGYIPL